MDQLRFSLRDERLFVLGSSPRRNIEVEVVPWVFQVVSSLFDRNPDYLALSTGERWTPLEIDRRARILVRSIHLEIRCAFWRGLQARVEAGSRVASFGRWDCLASRDSSLFLLHQHQQLLYALRHLPSTDELLSQEERSRLVEAAGRLESYLLSSCEGWWLLDSLKNDLLTSSTSDLGGLFLGYAPSDLQSIPSIDLLQITDSMQQISRSAFSEHNRKLIETFRSWDPVAIVEGCEIERAEGVYLSSFATLEISKRTRHKALFGLSSPLLRCAISSASEPYETLRAPTFFSCYGSRARVGHFLFSETAEESRWVELYAHPAEEFYLTEERLTPTALELLQSLRCQQRPPAFANWRPWIGERVLDSVEARQQICQTVRPFLAVGYAQVTSQLGGSLEISPEEVDDELSFAPLLHGTPGIELLHKRRYLWLSDGVPLATFTCAICVQGALTEEGGFVWEGQVEVNTLRFDDQIPLDVAKAILGCLWQRVTPRRDSVAPL